MEINLCTRNRKKFRDLDAGETFLYENEVFIKVVGELSTNDDWKSFYGAVNLATGQPVWFADVILIDPIELQATEI